MRLDYQLRVFYKVRFLISLHNLKSFSNKQLLELKAFLSFNLLFGRKLRIKSIIKKLRFF